MSLINSLIAGLLVLFGSFTSGYMSWQSLIAAVSASVLVFLNKLRDYLGNINHKKAMKGGLLEFL